MTNHRRTPPAPLKKPCPNCGRRYTFDRGCTVFCSCACEVVYRARKKP